MDTFYRLNRVLVFLAMVLYVPLVLAVVAGLAVGVWLLVSGAVGWLPEARLSPRGSGVLLLFVVFVSISAGGIALLLLLGLLRLFTRVPGEPPYGILLSPLRQPAFFELLGRVCTKLKVKPPQQCYLSPFDEMSIGERPLAQEGGKVGKNVRTLVIGAALLVHLRIDELTTVLAHEMAHAKAGDTRMCRLAWRFNNAMAESIVAQAREEAESQAATWLNFLVRMGLTAYYMLFNLMYAADERWREMLADQLSARICGPQNVRNALIEIHLAGSVPELSIMALLAEYCETGLDMGDLYNEHRRRWEQLPTERIRAAENETFLERHSLYDSHPCLAVRMRALKAIEAKEIRGEKPATKLFPDWERLAELMTQTLMRRGRYLHKTYMNRLLGGRV